MGVVKGVYTHDHRYLSRTVDGYCEDADQLEAYFRRSGVEILLLRDDYVYAQAWTTLSITTLRLTVSNV